MPRKSYPYGRSFAGYTQGLHKLNQRQGDIEVRSRAKGDSHRDMAQAVYEYQQDREADRLEAEAGSIGHIPDGDPAQFAPPEPGANLEMLGGPSGEEPPAHALEGVFPQADEPEGPDPRVVALKTIAAALNDGQGGEAPAQTKLPSFAPPRPQGVLSIPRTAQGAPTLPTQGPGPAVPFSTSPAGLNRQGRPSAMDVIDRFIQTARAGGLGAFRRG